MMETIVSLILHEFQHLRSRRHIVEGKVLVLCEAGLGDLLLAVPLLRSLSNSGLRVTLGASQVAAEFFKGQPFIDDCVTLPADTHARSVTARYLTGLSFNHVFSIRSHWMYPLRFWISASSTGWTSNPKYERIRLLSRLRARLDRKFRRQYYTLNHASEDAYSMHRGDDLPGLASLEFRNLFGLSSDVLKLRARESILRLLPTRYGVLQIAGKDTIRKLDRSVVERILKEISEPIVLVGAAEDRPIIGGLVFGESICDLVGQTNLAELYLIIAGASFCIAPDSLGMHIAASVGVPLVAIVGNARPDTFGPGYSRGPFVILDRNPPCSPCSVRSCKVFAGVSCVQSWDGDEILGALRSLKKSHSLTGQISRGL